MKASRLFLIVFTSAISFAVAEEGQPVPLADCPAIVQARLTENAERLKGTVGPVEKARAQETEFYDARIAGPDGKVWSVKVLTDGKVLEVVEKKQAKGKLVALHDSFRRWFGSVTGW